MSIETGLSHHEAKMKKLLTLFVFLLMASISFAAAPPAPMPVVFGFSYDGQPIENFQVELNLNGDIIKRTTNDQGKLMIDVGTGSPDFPNAKSMNIYQATLKLNCGFSVCNKEYSVVSLDTPYDENFVLAEAPPVTCSPCDYHCGGGGGGGSVYYTCTEEKCQEDYPCEDVTCPTCTICEDCEECPAEKVCTVEECEEVICPESTCPDPEETTNIGAIIIAIIGSLIVGGAGGAYFTRNKALTTRGGIKIYRGNDGEEKTLHKHPGINGYHDPETQHRDPKERHPKGQLFPQYEKDADGKWVYKG